MQGRGSASAILLFGGTGSCEEVAVNRIFYDLEGGLSPATEGAVPFNSINRAAAIVHNAGLKFGFTVVNVGRHPREIVPHVVANADRYNPQGQSLMHNGCSVYAPEVGEVLILAKRHNPLLRLWAQVSLRYGLESGKHCLTELVNHLDGRGHRLDGVTMFYGLDANHVSLLDQFDQWYTQQYRAFSGDVEDDGLRDGRRLARAFVDSARAIAMIALPECRLRGVPRKALVWSVGMVGRMEDGAR